MTKRGLIASSWRGQSSVVATLYARSVARSKMAVSRRYSGLHRSCRIPGHAASRVDVTRDNSACFNIGIVADYHAGHDDRAGANGAARANYRSTIDSSRMIVGKDDSPFGNHTSVAHPDALRPIPVDRCRRCDPCGRGDVHPPEPVADHLLEPLPQTLAPCSGRSFVSCHAMPLSIPDTSERSPDCLCICDVADLRNLHDAQTAFPIRFHQECRARCLAVLFARPGRRALR